ncbi:MAG: phosphoribosylglycinamide formyltransferase [Pseudomonadota bacterium]
MTALTAAILISGRGSNMEALLDAAIPTIRFTRVVSNRADAAGLERAAERGVEALCVPSKGRSREAFEADLTQAVQDVDMLCLAGFMRVLSARFVAAWSGRMINIHPSLLPAYPGLEPQARALADGVAESGCTVHWVTPDVDAGPIILQERVPVLPGDTVESLSNRILAAEHRCYPRAAAMAAETVAGTALAKGHA